MNYTKDLQKVEAAVSVYQSLLRRQILSHFNTRVKRPSARRKTSVYKKALLAWADLADKVGLTTEAIFTRHRARDL